MGNELSATSCFRGGKQVFILLLSESQFSFEVDYQAGVVRVETKHFILYLSV